MNGVGEGLLVRILYDLIKSPKLLIFLIILAPICTGIGYSIYSIEQIKQNFRNINDEKWNNFYNSVVDDLKYKQQRSKKLVELCDNGIPGSCTFSYWGIDTKTRIATATNYFVIRCEFTYQGKSFKCGTSLDVKYQQTLSIPHDLVTKIASQRSSCASSQWDEIKDISGSNFERYGELLDVELDYVSLCSHGHNISILTQVKGHNAKKKLSTSTVGCIKENCIEESRELNFDFLKMYE